MARSQRWNLFLVFLLGCLGASLFWFYGPVKVRQGGLPAPEQGVPPTLTAEKEVSSSPQGVGLRPPGLRYQLVSDGKNTFLADLKEGRVWRYYHHTREGGYVKEDEGFLPLPFYYGGKKLFCPGELDQAAGKPATPPAEVRP
jgi:hypothetical protein